MLRQTVAEGGGREGTVAVVAAETRTAVAADGERGKYEVVPVVVGFSKERDEVVAGGYSCGAFGSCSGIRPHILIVFEGEHFGI